MSRRIHVVGQTGYFVDPAGATLKEVGQRMQLDSTTCPTAFLTGDMPPTIVCPCSD